MENKNSGAVNNNDHPDKKDVSVGRDVSGSIFIAGNGNTINAGESGKREEPTPKKKRSRAARKKKTTKRKLNTPIIVALIGAVSVIVAAWLGSPIIGRLFPTPAPSSTPTPTVYVSETPTLPQATLESETPILPQAPLESVTPTFVFTDIPLPTFTASPPPDEAEEEMTVVFFGNPLDGKVPLRVNFNARESFVTFPDGSTIACGTTRLCDYTFKVVLNGTTVATDSNTDGLYSYKFGKKGQYIVMVTVCRDETCGGSRVTVNVR